LQWPDARQDGATTTESASVHREMDARPGPDGVLRCSWCLGAPEYVVYHDEIWGKPQHGERELFEMLVLESFQSGLSWLTILRRQAGFRAAFSDWDVERVAAYGPADVERLLADAGIIRHRGKIEATVANARAVLDLHAAGTTLDELLWSFAPAGDDDEAAAKALSAELKRRGFRFVGPTTALSLMEAAGIVDHHHPGCAFRG
jgi:DNA-3-methyladenine glycosylase I